MDISQCSCSGKTLNRLLQPALLAVLSRAPTHGYLLVQQLSRLEFFADAPPDTSGVYKALKQMELDGLVSSSWDLGDSGPARRRYSLSRDGRACLRQWACTLEAYRSQVDAVLGLLAGRRPRPCAR